MPMTLKQHRHLRTALEARARLTSREHDTACRLADRITIAAVVACIFIAYLAVSSNDEHTAQQLAATAQAQR